MAFAPLYQLFTTKEDRLAVYKAIQLGLKPKKSKEVFEKLRSIYSGDDYDGTEILTAENTANAKDKAEELAKKIGVDLLTVKQFIFCDLMAEAMDGVMTDAQPFLCTSVDEIDALGKKVFGARWEYETSKKDATYSVKYGCSALEPILKESKLTNIVHPFVYTEMFGTMDDYSNYGFCTLMACMFTASCLKWDITNYWSLTDLKDYLNNKPDRCVKSSVEELLERGFFYNLLCFRARKFSGMTLNCEYAFCNYLPGPTLPDYVLKNGNDELWNAYRSALIDCLKFVGESNSDWVESDIRNPYSGDARELAFFIDDIWFRYLRKDYKHLLTSMPMKVEHRSAYQNESYYMVVVDREDWPYKESNGYSKLIGLSDEKTRYHSPLSLVTDDIALLHDIKELPWNLDRTSMIKELSYTGYLYRALWDWDFDSRYGCKSDHKEFENSPKMLVTSSCFVSPLRRGGAELYFAFRTEDSEAEPLVLYVDNEEDKQFIEECASTVGAVFGDKNRIVMMSLDSAPALPRFTELDDNLDALTKQELFEESLRATFMLLMLSTHSAFTYTSGSAWGCYNLYTGEPHSENDKIPNTALFTVQKGGTFIRNTMALQSLLAVVGTYRTYGELFALDLTINDSVYLQSLSECAEGSTYLAFPRTDVVVDAVGGYGNTKQTCSVNLPVLVKNGCCKYVRWEEIPNLVPEWLRRGLT